MSSARKRSSRKAIRSSSSPPRTSSRRNIASSSARSTAAANAYVGPSVRRYLGEMGEHLEAAGFGGEFLIVQSTGGLFDVEEAQSACIRMLESGPAAGVIGTKALCDSIGLGNAIAFDMGGTTAKAGVIHDGAVLMTGGALIGGYATGLPVQIPMIDIQEVGTGGGSIARVEMGALHVGPESAGAAARSGLLRPGRRRAHHHRRQSRPRAACRRSLSRRRDAARRRRRRARARGARGRPARPRSHGGGRRHPAHRHHQDVPHGALGHHRARPRCRRFHPRGLRRRRAPARGDGRARAAHRQGGHPAGARPLLRLWHAGRRSAARFRQDLVHAAGRGVVSSHGRDLRRDGAARPRGGRAGARSPWPVSPCSARPTCATSARSMRSPSSSPPSCSRPRIATGSSGASMPCTRRATAIRRLRERAEIVSACAAPLPG